MRTQTWALSDELWQKIEPHVPGPPPRREADLPRKRKPGGGRKPVASRQTVEGILYVLRTGCQWNALPKEYGASSTVHRYFQYWTQVGFFETIWVLGLEAYDEMEGIAWEWQSLDGNLIKTPLALEAVGNNPTDRGKKRNQTQRSCGSTRLSTRTSP